VPQNRSGFNGEQRNLCSCQEYEADLLARSLVIVLTELLDVLSTPLSKYSPTNVAQHVSYR
jgi:hypothetical protein